MKLTPCHQNILSSLLNIFYTVGNTDNVTQIDAKKKHGCLFQINVIRDVEEERYTLLQNDYQVDEGRSSIAKSLYLAILTRDII